MVRDANFKTSAYLNDWLVWHLSKTMPRRYTYTCPPTKTARLPDQQNKIFDQSNASHHILGSRPQRLQCNNAVSETHSPRLHQISQTNPQDRQLVPQTMPDTPGSTYLSSSFSESRIVPLLSNPPTPRQIKIPRNKTSPSIRSPIPQSLDSSPTKPTTGSLQQGNLPDNPSNHLDRCISPRLGSGHFYRPDPLGPMVPNRKGPTHHSKRGHSSPPSTPTSPSPTVYNNTNLHRLSSSRSPSPQDGLSQVQQSEHDSSPNREDITPEHMGGHSILPSPNSEGLDSPSPILQTPRQQTTPPPSRSVRPSRQQPSSGVCSSGTILTSSRCERTQDRLEQMDENLRVSAHSAHSSHSTQTHDLQGQSPSHPTGHPKCRMENTNELLDQPSLGPTKAIPTNTHWSPVQATRDISSLSRVDFLIKYLRLHLGPQIPENTLEELTEAHAPSTRRQYQFVWGKNFNYTWLLATYNR